MIPRNRNILIIAVIAVMVIIGLVIYLISSNLNKPVETGGSGVPEKGTLILKNMDSPTNDKDKIALGEFLTTDQQTKMRNELQAVLALKKPLNEYDGTVIDGTVSVNYDTNDVSFTVHIDEFNTDYKVVMNTVSSDLTITDSANKKVN